MEPELVEKLLRLNQEFYATYAQSFAATRHNVQPGVQRLLPQIMQAEMVLDLGCGNGNLAELLKSEGFYGSYVGVDENTYFLEQAEAATQDASFGSYTFRQGSLADPGWLDLINQADAICSFATLHHLPGTDLHRQLFSSVRNKLSPNGRFFLSCWQLLGNQRLEKRLVPWNPADIEAERVDKHDLLMDWRADPGKTAKLRYVHHFSPSELRALGESQGLTLQDEFFSDGKEGNLGLYQVWQNPVP
jgi:tRNA (uracil-5-)-methyltransferase TRM9